MSEAGKLSAEQIRAFLAGSEEHHFRGRQRAEVYEWITRTLRAQEYRKQGKKMRGLLKRYVEKMTGRSRAQVTRLIGRYLEHSEVKESNYRRHRFASRFTRADVELLAQVDEAHETLSGPATKKILEREFAQYKQHRVPAAGDDLGGAHLQLAKASALPRVPHGLHQDPSRAGGHRRTAQTPAGRQTWISACGHSASGGPGRNQRRVSHQPGG